MAGQQVAVVGAQTHQRRLQVGQLLQQQEWGEAVEAIRRVLENDGGRLIRVGTLPKANAEESIAWHVSVREYCHWRLAALTPEAPEALTAPAAPEGPASSRGVAA